MGEIHIGSVRHPWEYYLLEGCELFQVGGRRTENTPISALRIGISAHEESEGSVIKDEGTLAIELANAIHVIALLNDAIVFPVGKEAYPVNLIAARKLVQSVKINAVIAWRCLALPSSLLLDPLIANDRQS